MGLGMLLLLFGCIPSQKNISKEASVVKNITTNVIKKNKIINLGDFAECLTEKGAQMYGTTWCSHCNAQKEMFGEYKSKIPFIDCDKEKKLCQKLGITGYPTWIFADKSQARGRQLLEKLASKTGCTLPK